MRSFHPYTIHHLWLNELEKFEPNIGNHYVVMWCKNFPLGHVWLTIKNKFDRAAFLNDVHKAIYNTINYYAAFGENAEWRNLLSQHKFSALDEALKNSIQSYKATLNQNLKEKISVVICTRNRATALQECLASLSKINDTNIEIIVVDNASTDNNATKKVAQQFNNVKYVFEERKGLDIARNTGAKNASYNIIAYTDDDVKIPANWISNIRSCFADPLTMAVTGLVLPAELQTPSQFVFEDKWSFNKGYVPKVFDHKYFLTNKNDVVKVWDIGAGANMAFRRELFNLAGLFDERLDVGAAGCSGDSEMWYRVLAEGWNCVYFPHAYVYHQHRKTQAELNEQLFSYMKGHTAAVLIQHEKYKNESDINYIQKTLPDYYQGRTKGHIKSLVTGKYTSLPFEKKGYLAGIEFYNNHKNEKQPEHLSLSSSLNKDVIIKDDTVVSVIIPCYNTAHFLNQAIESALNQTYKNVEVIVVDDGSDDNTKEVCATFQNKVKYVRVERVGLSAARNIGVQFCKGDFVIFLDADDYLYENAVELNLYFFSENKNIVFVSGGYNKIDIDGNYLDTVVAEPKNRGNYISLLHGNYIGMVGNVMYRRDLFFYFHFDTSLKACEDYDLNLKVSRMLPVYHHDKKIAVYRMHGNNMSKNHELMLGSALLVLKRQEYYLENDEARNAYAQGINNWKNFYA